MTNSNRALLEFMADAKRLSGPDREAWINGMAQRGVVSSEAKIDASGIPVENKVVRPAGPEK